MKTDFKGKISILDELYFNLKRKLYNLQKEGYVVERRLGDGEGPSGGEGVI